MSGLKKYGILTSLLVFGSITTTHASSDVYANFPITLKGYSGDAKTSESYGGQMARHMLTTALKRQPLLVIWQKWKCILTEQKVYPS